jgi:tetratricopeptide (TPR) repeat protein
MNWTLLDERWTNRHDATVFEELESELDRALYNQKTPDYPLVWRWARLSHFRAMQAQEAGDWVAAQRHFKEGAKEAETAAALQPNRVEGLFWAGVCLIESARLTNKLAALRVLNTATHHIDRAANIDETYHFAGPLRVQGRMTHRRPLLLGGSINLACDIYRRALELAPENSTTRLYYAEAILADQEWEKAREQLRYILNAPPCTGWIWEQERDKKLAHALLEEHARH